MIGIHVLDDSRGGIQRGPEVVLYRPFMIGICQGQTELSSRILPTETLCSSTIPEQARALCTPVGSVYVFVQFVFGLEFLHRLGSTAKRDQSFICAYPALREGLHGRLSLGNPPALKQSVWVHREASLPRTGRYTARTGGNSR